MKMMHRALTGALLSLCPLCRSDESAALIKYLEFNRSIRSGTLRSLRDGFRARAHKRRKTGFEKKKGFFFLAAACKNDPLIADSSCVFFMEAPLIARDCHATVSLRVTAMLCRKVC